MNINEVLSHLQNLTNSKITQTELGVALGKTRSDISLKAKRGTELKLSDIRKIEEYFKVDLIQAEVKQNINTANFVKNLADMEAVDNFVIDYYPDVFGSCGSGNFVLSENKELLSVPKKFFNSYKPYKLYSVINAIGDSMSPYIEEKDFLIVEHYDGEQIKDNHIYVFRLGDNIFVKRLVYNIDQVVIKSDNTLYPVRFVEGEKLQDFQLIGEIVGLMRDLM